MSTDRTRASSSDPFAVVGHSRVEAQLVRLWQRSQLPGGLLFDGPQGIGKATVAHRLARFLLAQRVPEAAGTSPSLFGVEPTPSNLAIDPDNPVARRVASGGHSDLLTIGRPPEARGDAELPVAEVRRVPQFLHQTAGEGGWRIVIVDDADRMNVSAANALLKILEEPPSHALVILVAHLTGRLPAAIRSRCRRVSFHPIDTDRLADWLGTQRDELTASQRSGLARLAEGRPGQALALADNDGLALCGELETLLAALPRPDWGQVHALGERLAGRKNADGLYRVFVEQIFLWLGAVIRQASGRPASSSGGQAVFPDSLARHGQSGCLESWLAVWDKIAALTTAADNQYLDRKQVVLRCFSYLTEAGARQG